MSISERVFISGAAGVIGREMLLYLSSFPNVTVLAADKKPEPKGLPSNIEYRQGDLNELSVNEIREFSPSIFIHLAASFERSLETLDFWTDNFDNNVKLSHHLMGVMKDIPSLKRVVFASSYLVYDENQYQFESPKTKAVSLPESSLILPRNMVGMAKLAHEKELEFLTQFYSDKFSTLSVRIFRGYGRGSRDVVSRWIRNLISGNEIMVYNPEGIFDYIYAKDTAVGILKLALHSNLAGVVNLGTGQSRRVSDVLEVLKKYFPNMKLQTMQSDSFFEASEADISKLISETDWKPVYKLEDAIGEIIEFESSRFEENLEKKNLKILITSSSHKSALIRAVQKAGKSLDQRIQVVAGDSRSNVVTRYTAEDFWEMPKLDDSRIQEVIEYCQISQIGLIIPTRDGELDFWARHKEEFTKQDIEVLISSPGTIENCLDKLKFYEITKKFGFNPIYTTTDQKSLLSRDLLVVKERFGAGSRDIGVGLEFEKASLHALKLENPIFQPLIVGQEISADIWIIPGVYESVVLRYRTIVVGGESQVTQIFRDESIEKYLLGLAKKLHLVGPAVIQAIIDESGQINIIECNPRVGGASTASNAAGTNAFRKMIQHYLLGQYIGPIGKFERVEEIIQVRSAFDEYTYDSSL